MMTKLGWLVAAQCSLTGSKVTRNRSDTIDNKADGFVLPLDSLPNLEIICFDKI